MMEKENQDKTTSKRTQKLDKKRKKTLWISLLIVVLIAAGVGGFLGYRRVQTRKQLAKDIISARELVVFNPLAKGKQAKKLRAFLPKIKEQTSDAMLLDELDATKFSQQLQAAQTEVDQSKQKELSHQKTSAKTIQTKLAKLAKDDNFPSQSKQELTSLNQLATLFTDRQDAVGLNIAVAGLQALAGDSTTFIQAKTKAQKAREAAAKKEKEKLAAAIKNETYPSLGMLRGDMPNGIGVLPMFLQFGGPAEMAGLQTDNDWDDSSVITAIDGKPVHSAILGDHSMQQVLQTIPLGSRVKVKFLDGSTQKVTLNLTQKEADKEEYPDLPVFPDEANDTLNFGVSGYNIAQKHHNKEIGLVVTDLDQTGSIANQGDIKIGDTICRVGQYYIGTTTDIRKALSDYDVDDEVSVDYVTAAGHLATSQVTLKE